MLVLKLFQYKINNMILKCNKNNTLTNRQAHWSLVTVDQLAVFPVCENFIKHSSKPVVTS